MKPSPRLHLVEARKNRQWSQQEVADRLGTTQHNVSRWERGATTPTAYFQAKLCALFDTTPQELGLGEQAQPSSGASKAEDVEPAPTPPHVPEAAPRLWTVPYPRNPFFLGRDEELAQIRSCLQAGQAMALSHPQAISGLGGIGKTQLALEYAYRSAQDYHAVLWARAESTEALVSSYVAFADCFALPEREAKEQAVIVEAVTRWLGTHQDWLLILDNADELAILPDFLPSPLGGHVLITTRAAATGRLARRIQIEILPPEQGAVLLLRRSGLLAPDAELSHASLEEHALALHLSEELGGLPLALDQAGAYLEETGIALEEYWQLYQQHRTNLLQRRGGLVADHPLPVAATWSVSFQRIAAQSPAAAALLKLLAWLPADAIAEEIFSAGAACLGPVLAPIAENALLLNQAMEALRAASLIRRHPNARMLSLHRLVQVVLQDQQEPSERQRWAARAVQAINAAFPDVQTAMEHAAWVQCERLVPQALCCCQQEQEAGPSLASASLAYKTAEYLRERGRYEEAKPLYQQALALREQLLGVTHPEVARTLFPLALLSLNLGKYTQAEACYQRALQIYEQHPLEAHQREIARLLTNLGTLSLTLGKYAQAEGFYQRALALQEQEGSQQHPDEVARSLHNLALLSARQGNYREAEPLYRRALSLYAASEQQCGTVHPDRAITLHGLATLLCEQGQYREAEARAHEALHISERCLGPEHPQVAMALQGLATLSAEQGRYREAEQLYERALQINEHSLGPQHFTVAVVLSGLATLLREQGKEAEAEPLYQRAVRIWERQMGPEHPDMALTLHDLARLYQAQGKYGEAEPLYQRACMLYERTFGPEHPHMARILANLATLLCEQGRYREAEPLYQRALQISKRHLGPEHPQTAETLHALALFHQQQGHLDEAISLARRAVQIRSQVLGDAHATTIAARKLSTQLLQEQASTQEGVSWE